MSGRSVVLFRLRPWLAVLLLPTLCSCGFWLDANDRLERAQEARAEGDVRAALVELKALLQKEPGILEARLELGEISLQIGDVASAIRELELAKKGGFEMSRVAAPLARAYLADQRAQNALAIIDAAPELSGRADMLALKGTALLELGRTAEANAAFLKATEADPRSVDAVLGLASVVARTEGNAAALVLTDRALEIAPDNARVYLARGALHLHGRDSASAESDFRLAADRAARQSSPVELLAALAGLADAQLARGSIELALTTTARMQQIAPNNAVSRYLRARALFVSGRLDEARPLLEQNVSTSEHVLSRLLLGAVMLARGDLGQAEMYLAAVVAKQPRNIAARQLLAETRLRQQKPDDALDAIMPVLDTPEASAQLFALAGRASLAAGATASGLQYLQQSVRVEDANGVTTLDLAAGYIATGQLGRARALLESMPLDEVGSSRRAYLTALTHLAADDRQGAVDYAMNLARTNPDSAANQVLAGALLAQLGRLDQAEGYFKRGAELQPNSPSVYVNLGRLATMQGDVQRARSFFLEAVKHEPGHPGALLALAFLDLSLNRPTQALAALADLRVKHPKLVEGRILETQILVDLRDFDQALMLARSVMRDAPERAGAHVAHARVLFASGQPAESIKALEAAVRKLPKSVLLRFELARSLATHGQAEAAERWAKAVLDVEPRHAGAMELLSRLAQTRGDSIAAQRLADDLLSVAPDQISTYLLSGDLALAQKNYGKAAAAYGKGSALSSDPTAAWREYVARRLGGLANPLEPLERSAAERPRDARVWLALGDAQQQLGLDDRAAESYERVLRDAADHPAALNNLAWLRHKQGNDEALDLAKRAYQAAPKRAEIADTYAWILIERGRAREGMQLLAPIAGPQASPEIRLHYAIALARSGEKSEARAIAESLVEGRAPAEINAQARNLLTSLD